jgi:single-stranded-DNA-specific exonuclease
MKDMHLAVERVDLAIKRGEHVRVYGDYDVDGTTSTSMLYLFLKEIGAQVSYTIPDRFTDGYGLSLAGIEHARRDGVTCLVAVDCGTTAVVPITRARALGIDVIVCDHHEPDRELPPCNALLNPIQQGCPYPFKSLCGCGVGFKFMQAMAQHLKLPEEHVLKYLDFVAVASVADIVPLVDENRILASYGLQLLNGAPRAGFRALFACAGLQAGALQTTNIVFGLAPRINAAGRIGDATRAVRLLTSEDDQVAFEIAQELEADNRSRRTLDEETFAIAQQLIDSTLDRAKDRVIVIHHEHWHPGVIGIVASRVVERYYLPAVMLTTIEGAAKGSARSISGFDIHSALRKSEDLMINFGGHKYAAGLSLDPKNVSALRENLNAYAREAMTDDMLVPEIVVDTPVEAADLTLKFQSVLRQMAPFGPSNAKPVFLMKNLESAGVPRIVGNNHLKFRVRQGINGQAVSIDAIGFGLGGKLDRVRSGQKFDVVAVVEDNTYNGRSTMQLRVRDIR